MGKRLPPSVVRDLVRKAKDRASARVDEFEGVDNPQVVLLRKKAKSEWLALEAVYEAMTGDPTMLKILAGE